MSLLQAADSVPVHEGRAGFWTFMRDASSHFRLRATEWGALATLANFGAFLHNHPMLLDQPGYSCMARLASPGEWATLGITVGIAHLAALIVNGSVPSIRWTPIARAACSALGALFWLQLALGSLVFAGAETVFAPMLVVLNLYNCVNAATEIRGE